MIPFEFFDNFLTSFGRANVFADENKIPGAPELRFKSPNRSSSRFPPLVAVVVGRLAGADVFVVAVVGVV